MMDVTRLAQLLDEHAAALVLYARQWCRAPEDVVQEAFLKLVGQDPWPAPVVPWLFRVVRNGALSAARAEQRRRRHETRAGQTAAPWFEPRGDVALDAAEVSAVLPTLQAEQREAITLHLWGGLSFAEAAEVMGCSASSAHRWYLAGLEQLRLRISPCPNPLNER